MQWAKSVCLVMLFSLVICAQESLTPAALEAALDAKPSGAAADALSRSAGAGGGGAGLRDADWALGLGADWASARAVGRRRGAGGPLAAVRAGGGGRPARPVDSPAAR